MNPVEQSYEYCRRVARTRAKNFYYAFLLLTAQQRKAMCAIYAFMRHCDDLSDEPGATRAALEGWRGNSRRLSRAVSAGIPSGRRSTTRFAASASRTTISAP